MKQKYKDSVWIWLVKIYQLTQLSVISSENRAWDNIRRQSINYKQVTTQASVILPSNRYTYSVRHISYDRKPAQMEHAQITSTGHSQQHPSANVCYRPPQKTKQRAWLYSYKHCYIATWLWAAQARFGCAPEFHRIGKRLLYEHETHRERIVMSSFSDFEARPDYVMCGGLFGQTSGSVTRQSANPNWSPVLPSSPTLPHATVACYVCYPGGASINYFEHRPSISRDFNCLSFAHEYLRHCHTT